MTKFKLLLLAVLAPAMACSSSSSNDAGFPTVPTLGVEIDRMGRPAINTALTAPLNSFALGDGGTLTADQAKDYYNATDDSTKWKADFGAAFSGSLAVYDSLDGVCGNQLLAQADAGTAVYATLSAVLVDDQLYVDTGVGACVQYLAVEAEAVGKIAAGTDCGGRTPTEDTIDTTYSALAAGAFMGVGDGIPSSAGGTANITTFPFLGNPQ